MFENKILTEKEMKIYYGNFYTDSLISDLQFDLANIPKSLRVLLPYVRFWGAPDDYYRDSLVSRAKPSIRANFASVFSSFENQFDEWLGGEEADNPIPSDEYIAYSAARMAAELAGEFDR